MASAVIYSGGNARLRVRHVSFTHTYIHTYQHRYQHTNIPPPQATGGGTRRTIPPPQATGGGDQKNHTTTTGHRGGPPPTGGAGKIAPVYPLITDNHHVISCPTISKRNFLVSSGTYQPANQKGQWKIDEHRQSSNSA